MNFRRAIIGRARKEQEFREIRSHKSYKHSDEVRYTSLVRVSYGWRLECGHVLPGQYGAGKKSVDCYYCEWVAEGTHAHLADQGKDGWTDVTESPRQP